MLTETDLIEMGVTSEDDREQILEAAKGLAAKVVTAYRPAAGVPSTPPPSQLNNNNDDEKQNKECANGDNNDQVLSSTSLAVIAVRLTCPFR